MITFPARCFLSAFLLSTCCLTNSVQAAANEAPPPIRDEIPQAVLQGTGTYRWFGLTIYDAALWLPAGSNPDTRQRFALDLTYARNLYGNKIAEASIDEIEKLKFGTAEQRQRWLLQMKGIFPDVREGSRITGIHIPNEAARFYLNGKFLGEIRDPEFARSFFAIWLDKKTSAPDLRSKLLGNLEKTYQ
ncbi:chalcone isomerase family protein [Undibacterium sp. WLX3042]|uniref:chalcone isomerase family protein n=1 Tax=Undibacterium sp. WLX3042 TaxID=3412686 RepID=UPI003C2C21C3